jgi:hypothetical protein
VVNNLREGLNGTRVVLYFFRSSLLEGFIALVGLIPSVVRGELFAALSSEMTQQIRPLLRLDLHRGVELFEAC